MKPLQQIALQSGHCSWNPSTWNISRRLSSQPISQLFTKTRRVRSRAGKSEMVGWTSSGREIEGGGISDAQKSVFCSTLRKGNILTLVQWKVGVRLMRGGLKGRVVRLDHGWTKGGGGEAWRGEPKFWGWFWGCDIVALWWQGTLPWQPSHLAVTFMARKLNYHRQCSIAQETLKWPISQKPQ